MKEHFTKIGILVTVGAVLLLVVCGWLFVKGKGESKQIVRIHLNKQATVKLMTVSDFPPVTSTSTQKVHDALLAAFMQGALRELSSDEIPDSNASRLILAAPIMNSDASGTIECGLQYNPLCGLYVRPAKGNPKLLLWGSALSGFNGVESFPDSKHAIIATMWNLYDFTSVDRSQLDLETGELVPRLLIEQDVSDTGVDIRTSGYGDVVTLSIQGTRLIGMIIPKSIVVKNQSGTVVQTLSNQDVQNFASIVKDAVSKKQTLDSLLITPTPTDVQTLTLPMILYGEPYVLDLKAKRLQAAMSQP